VKQRQRSGKRLLLRRRRKSDERWVGDDDDDSGCEYNSDGDEVDNADDTGVAAVAAIDDKKKTLGETTDEEGQRLVARKRKNDSVWCAMLNRMAGALLHSRNPTQSSTDIARLCLRDFSMATMFVNATEKDAWEQCHTMLEFASMKLHTFFHFVTGHVADAKDPDFYFRRVYGMNAVDRRDWCIHVGDTRGTMESLNDEMYQLGTRCRNRSSFYQSSQCLLAGKQYDVTYVGARTHSFFSISCFENQNAIKGYLIPSTVCNVWTPRR
jgi:hypothetical protein